MDERNETERNGADEEKAAEDFAGTEGVAEGTGNDTNEQTVRGRWLGYGMGTRKRACLGDTHVTVSEMMLEFATWLDVRCRSSLMVAVNCDCVEVSSDSAPDQDAEGSSDIRGGSGDVIYQRNYGVPSPEGNHKAKPREEENSAVDVDGVEGRNCPGLAVDRVDLWVGIQMGEFERHCGWLAIPFHLLLRGLDENM